MNKEFAPYEQALALKELGFDEPCFGYFNKTWSKENELLFPQYVGELENWNNTQHLCSAPTFSQAFRWFRERWGYDIHVRGTNFRASYVIGIPKEINMESGDGYPLVIDWDYIVDGTGVRKTYEEAELACLRKLIEIVKNK